MAKLVKKAEAVLAVAEVASWAKEEERKITSLFQAGKAQEAELRLAANRHRTMKEVLRFIQAIPTDSIDEALYIVTAYKAQQAQGKLFSEPKNPR